MPTSLWPRCTATSCTLESKTGFFDVWIRQSDHYAAEITCDSQGHWLNMFEAPCRPKHEMNFLDVQSRAKAEFIGHYIEVVTHKEKKVTHIVLDQV